jgi:hypothetical protein
MPPFFLHVRDGAHLIGSCLPAFAAAKNETVLSARKLMSHSIVGERRLKIGRRFEIGEYDSKTVATLPFRETVR